MLIEKDWLAFGHKFDDRCAHVAPQNDEAAKEVQNFKRLYRCCYYYFKII